MVRWLAIAVLVVVLLLASCSGSDSTGGPPSVATAGAPALAGSNFLVGAQQHIAAREYWASPTQDGLQAPNRRHDLRSWFEPTGVRVQERRAPDSPTLVELRLTGVGRNDQLAPVAPGELTHHEGRVEIQREGLIEWYENSERGLEQGFTLAARPAAATPGELVLELSVAGARAGLRGDDVALATKAGRTLSYGKLVVLDAKGDRLLARFEVTAPDRVRLIADDTRAAYPIIIDPLLEETADVNLESNQANAYFGSSVASAGDVNGDGYDDVIIGAPYYDAGQADEGAAFVFLGSPNGIEGANPATAHAQLEGDSGNAQMGTSVASAGDVNGDGYDDVIVGAPVWFNEGAAFLFLGSTSGIADGNPASAHAQFEGNQLLPFMGYSVASAGDVNGDGYDDVIVGAPTYSIGGFNSGAAFVFLGSATGIPDGSPASADTQLDGEISSKLGQSVASAGDVNGDGYADVIVGAQSYSNGQSLEGAAFVFLGSNTGIADASLATAHARLESDQANALMGQSVASAGDVNGDGYADVIVGAHNYDAGQTDEGAAFVFLGSAAGIANGNPASAHALLENNESNAQMGRSVASAGDVNGDGYADVIVGAPLAGQSAATVYLGSANGIITAPYAQFAANQANALTGQSVASAGDVNGDGFDDVIVGIPAFSSGQSFEGSAFVSYGDSGMRSVGAGSAHAQFSQDVFHGNMGFSVASAGDVNGDGYGDVIIGAPQYDLANTGDGAAFVFLGSPDGLADGSPASADTQLDGALGSRMGQSVASAGDVNGDGYADVIVGAEYYANGQVLEGAAFVFLGSVTGIADGNLATAHARLESDQASAFMGHSVASAGDVNGDGYADVIVGAHRFNAGEGSGEGAAFLFLGSASGIASGGPSTADAQFESDQIGANMGVSVASAGDVNGDGYADVIVGADLYSAGETSEGAAFVFLGSAVGIADGNPTTAHAQLESNQSSARMGSGVSSAGDVNGDGYADVIVGAKNYAAGQIDEGAAFVFLGSPSGIANGNPTTAHAQLEANAAGVQMGRSVASVGDLNGDGYADVIVGAEGYSSGSQPFDGVAFVFLGSASGIGDGNPITAYAWLVGAETGSGMGYSVASAGDVNGDGYADVIVGAPFEDVGAGDGGAAYVFLDNSEGRPIRMRQRRGDGSGIVVQPWGSAADPDEFEVELLASHPTGVGRVRAEVEACPAGVAFEALACTTTLSPTWIQLVPGTPDPLLSTSASGLASDTLYHWRARVLYADPTGPLPANPAHSPWRRLAGQSVEGDIRTVPEAGALASLMAGSALLYGLARRRARQSR